MLNNKRKCLIYLCREYKLILNCHILLDKRTKALSLDDVEKKHSTVKFFLTSGKVMKPGFNLHNLIKLLILMFLNTWRLVTNLKTEFVITGKCWSITKATSRSILIVGKKTKHIIKLQLRFCFLLKNFVITMEGF